jgi:uncharacterized membrane protein
MLTNYETTTIQDIARILLGAAMVFAGTGHLTFLRREFQAQVPGWVPLNKDFVVVASGVVEILLGLGMILWTQQKSLVGIVLAVFYVAIFPGNIYQYTNHVNGFGLSTDRKRFIRLFFQPVLILWALWSVGVV